MGVRAPTETLGEGLEFREGTGKEPRGKPRGSYAVVEFSPWRDGPPNSTMLKKE